jgi:hypothetical protein
MTDVDNHSKRDFGLLTALIVLIAIAMAQKSTPGISPVELLLSAVVPSLVGLAALVWILSSQKRTITVSNMAFWLILFGGWSVWSVIPAIANDVEIVVWGRRMYAPFTLVTTALVTVYTVRSRKHISILYTAVIITCFLMMVAPLLSITTVDLSSINNLQQMRKLGRGKFAAIFIMLISPYLLNYRWFSQTQRIAIIIGVFIAGISLLMSFTRTLWVSSAVAAVFVASMQLHKKRPSAHTTLLACGGSLAIGFLIITMAPDKFLMFVLERLESLPNALQSKSLQDRIFELRGLIADLTSNPVMLFVGNGFGAKFTFYSVSPFSWSGVGWTSNAYSHNYYAYLLWSIGAIGLTCFLRFWYLIFRDGVRIMISDGINDAGFYLLGCMAALVVLFVSSLTVPLLTDLKWCVIFGILGGISMYLIRNPYSEDSNPT